MEEKLRLILTKPLNDIGLVIDKITFKKDTLYIVLDSDDLIDLDRITTASKLINKILDEEDIIKDKYLLDISSKEKGDVK